MDDFSLVKEEQTGAGAVGAGAVATPASLVQPVPGIKWISLSAAGGCRCTLQPGGKVAHLHTCIVYGLPFSGFGL